MKNNVLYLGIVGSRTFSDYSLFTTKISKIVNKLRDKYEKIVFVSGGATGADSFAKTYATENDIEIIEFLPNWDKYKKAAAFKRDHQIVDKSDMLVAFWDGESKGTLHSMKLMNIKCINRVIIIRF
jgi:uncharacterized phage-like protein YoqJ